MKHGKTIFHQCFCTMTNNIRKGRVTKMRNFGIMTLLDRGRLVSYHLCRYSRVIFAGVVGGVDTNQMWKNKLYCSCLRHHQFQATLYDGCMGGIEV